MHRPKFSLAFSCTSDNCFLHNALVLFLINPTWIRQSYRVTVMSKTNQTVRVTILSKSNQTARKIRLVGFSTQNNCPPQFNSIILIFSVKTAHLVRILLKFTFIQLDYFDPYTFIYSLTSFTQLVQSN